MAFQQALLRAGTQLADIERYRTARADKAREDLAEFARSTIGSDQFTTGVLDGEAGRGLVRFSNRQLIDLLAMGPHGRGVVLETLLGSVTRRVLDEAACDVLVAMPQRSLAGAASPSSG